MKRRFLVRKPLLAGCLLTGLTLSAALVATGTADTSDVTVIDAESGSAEHIQAAIDAAQTGDIVQIPPGEFKFSGKVNLPDGIHIRGAGRDETFIVKEDMLSQWDGMFNVSCTTGEPFIFSDITLQGIGRIVQGDDKRGGAVRDQGVILIGNCTDFQIYNNRFTKFSRAGIEVVGRGGTGEPTGVIYNNQFSDIWYPDLGYGVEIIGDEESWDRPVELGSSQAVFVEDNAFELMRHTVAANNAARYVFRFNTVRNNYHDAAAIDAHGPSSWPRGTRSYEIYGNTIENSITRWAGVGLRGGDGVVFSNTISGVSNGIMLMVEGYSRKDKYPKEGQIRDAWFWDNIVNGKAIKDVKFWSRQRRVGKLLKEGRDYHMEKRPDYVPYTYPHPLRIDADAIRSAGG